MVRARTGLVVGLAVLSVVLLAGVGATVLVTRPVDPPPVGATPIDLSGATVPTTGAQGWPIDVVHEHGGVSEGRVGEPLFVETARFRADSWADWTMQQVRPASLDGTVVPDSGGGGCAMVVDGRSGTGPSCDVVEFEPLDDTRRPGEGMGASALLRPLGGLSPDRDQVFATTLTLADGTQRDVLRLRHVVRRPCEDMGLTCPDADGPVAEVTTVVADRGTWVPILVEVEVDGTVVNSLRAISIDGHAVGW